jgi:hypothetical protein
VPKKASDKIPVIINTGATNKSPMKKDASPTLPAPPKKEEVKAVVPPKIEAPPPPVAKVEEKKVAPV